MFTDGIFDCRVDKVYKRPGGFTTYEAASRPGEHPMSIVAFNFTKISAERNANQSKYQVQNKTAIDEIKTVDLGKQKTLVFTFVQETDYSPNLGKILLKGEVVVLSNEKEAADTIASFNKNKRFEAKLMEKVYNAILQRCGVESLILARDIGLPSPVRLPRLNATPAKAASAPAAAAAKPAAKSPAKKK